MPSLSFRRAFALFHATLGLVVLLLSIGAFRRALLSHAGGAPHTHILVIAAAEALAAILFLLPKTLDMGGTVLLVIFAIAFLLHGIRGQWDLFVYAAGVILVMVNGSTFRKELFRTQNKSS